MKNRRYKDKIFIFPATVVILVVLIDGLFGIFVDLYLSKYSLPGEYRKIEYLMKESSEDLIILGSSLAINAYIPEIIEDSLGITCFNGGCNSQSLPFFQCMIESMLNRYTPRCIVLSLRKEELVLNSLARFGLLMPYYHRGNPSIDYFLEMENKGKTLFFHSNLYRYNTIGWRMLLYQIKSFDEIERKGFVPHTIPKFQPNLDDQSMYSDYYYCLNPVREESFRKIIRLCKDAGIQLIVTLPPVYIKFPDNGRPYELIALENLCKENNIPFINDSQSPFFLSRPDLFYDSRHLNYIGSEIYTKKILKDWKMYF
jgi:hypothetical protein